MFQIYNYICHYLDRSIYLKISKRYIKISKKIPWYFIIFTDIYKSNWIFKQYHRYLSKLENGPTLLQPSFQVEAKRPEHWAVAFSFSLWRPWSARSRSRYPKWGSPSRFINQPRSLRQRLWPHHEQGPDPCVCFRNQRGKKKALIGDLAGPCQ